MLNLRNEEALNDARKSLYKGDNTKWKWAFVELEGRYVIVTKNMMNLKTAVLNTEPSSPDYEPTMFHLALIKKLLFQAADRYREKYELCAQENLNGSRHWQISKIRGAAAICCIY